MVINWSNFAKKDLYEYRINSTINNVSEYINNLVDYIDCLISNPFLGRHKFNLDDGTEVRELIYKMHRILYTVENDFITILVVAHTLRDVQHIIDELKKR